jgi:hypothetical protein
MVFDDDEPIDDQPSVGRLNETVSQPFPYSFEELDAAFTAAMEEDRKLKEDEQRSKLEQVRYRCHNAGCEFLGRPTCWWFVVSAVVLWKKINDIQSGTFAYLWISRVGNINKTFFHRSLLNKYLYC